MSKLLEIADVSLRFGGITALAEVSLTVRAGGITALIGPNGAGKTSLFNCVTGFYRPTAGRILLHGETGVRELQLMDQSAIAGRARVARTFQNIRLFGGLSCLENLLVAQHRHKAPGALPSLLGLARAKSAERAMIETARSLLARFDLLPHANLPAASLPYGAQRRLEIARTLATNPVLLCLDEPAAGLNDTETGELAARLQGLRDEGLTILLIEHHMGLVMKLADHVAVLDAGRKIAEGSPAEVRGDAKVIAAYLGEEA